MSINLGIEGAFDMSTVAKVGMNTSNERFNEKLN